VESFTTLIHRSSTIVLIRRHQNITCSALVPVFWPFFWLQPGIMQNHSLHSHTGLVPFYLSVGTRIFQPRSAPLWGPFFCPFFSASTWNNAEPFTTLTHRSGTILFISRHQNISTQTCSALVPLFCPFFSASTWNNAEPFTTLTHRSGTILFISRHQNISTQTCSALVPLFLLVCLRLVLAVHLCQDSAVCLVPSKGINILTCMTGSTMVRFMLLFGSALVPLFLAICLCLVPFLVPPFWLSVCIITRMSGSALVRFDAAFLVCFGAAFGGAFVRMR
jgi:hypothetical protein